MFIRDAWYVAAWDRDLKDGPLPITVLGDAVVLYRQSNGRAVALEDACVHRKLPLSMGRVQGDLIECGYHGLKFDASGTCVHVPCSDRIPRNAAVRSYPVESRYGLLWIWMGRPARARPGEILQVEHWDQPGWGHTEGDAMMVDCHYLLVTDNLLDPSHVSWVHPSSFGGGASTAVTPVDVVVTPRGVCASRWIRSAAIAPLYRPLVNFEGLCDRLQQYEVRFPAHALVRAVFVPAGTSADAAAEAGATAPGSFVMDSYNLLTPVDAEHTRYFWFQVHNAQGGAAAASAVLAEGVKGAFEEDRIILNAVQKSFARTATPHVDIAIDSAPLRFRRLTRKLLDAERAAIGSVAEPAAVQPRAMA